MRRFLTLIVGLFTTLAVAVPAVQILSTTAANAAENGSLSAALSSSWQANATVWKLAYAHNDVYIVGDFTSLRPPGSAAGTNEHPVTYFAALNAATGAMDPAVASHTFTGQPAGTLPLTNGIVAASPDGNTIYVGGTFTKVDGQTRNHIAAFNAANGALISTFHPSVNGQVNAILASGSTVYIGGTFTTIAAAARTNIGAVSASNGALLSWGTMQPSTDNTVDAMAASPDGSQVVIGGYFDTVDGLTSAGSTSYNKAAIIGGVGSANPGVLEPMPADSVVPVGTAAHNPNGCISNVKDIVISSGVAYIGDEGTGGGCFDGTWAVNLTDGSLKWVNVCLGATQAVQVVGNYLYKGSHNHTCQQGNNNGDPNNFPQVPVNQNRHLTSEQLSNGFLGPWNPDMNAGPNLGPRGMATDGSQLFVGGDFTVVNNTNQQGIARFTSTNDFIPPRPAPAVAVAAGPGSVNVFVQAPVDADDPDLTLELYRDGGTTPIASKNVHSLFWEQPVVGFTDSGLALGSQHTYKVAAFETFGTNNGLMSGISNKVTVSNGATGYAATVLSQNPVGYWRLGEPSGTIAADSSPTLNGGVYTGGVTLAQPGGILGDSDTAATFDGSTGYFSSGASQPSPTVFTAEAWIKTTSTTGGKIIGFGNNQIGDSGNYDKHVYMTNAGKLIFGTYNGGTDTIQTGNSYNNGAWHQVVATQGPSGMSLFVDGVKAGSNPTTTNQSYNGFWRVGEDNLNGWPSQPTSNYFSGSIDDVSVYNTALTPAQVGAQYTAAGYTLPVAPGSNTPYAKNVIADAPSLFWRLDEHSGTSALDLSGNGNNGSYGTADTLGVTGAITDGSSPADTAISSNGTDSGVMVAQSQSPSPTNYSVEAWFKTTHAGGKIVGFGNSASATGSGSYDKHIYFNSDGSLNFGVWNGEMDIVSAPGTLHLADGNWHHVVGTQDGSGMKLYVDGNLAGSNAITTNQAYNGYWHVGGDSGWSNAGNDFNGSVDEVAIYPYALSGTQVLSDYQIGTGQTTTPTPPPSPSKPTVTSSSATTADISWTAVAGASSYQVQRSVSGANSFVNVGSPVTGTTVHDSGLTPGGSYDYQVIASNTGGNSAPSPITTVTTAPGQPGPLTASPNGTSEIDLSWTAANGATSYDVQRGPGGSGAFPTDLGPVAGTTFSNTGLNPGDSFDYRVVPSNTSGSGTASNTATATTLPAQVTGLTANAVSASEVDLSWNTATGATGYVVQRAPHGTTTWSTLSSGASATAFADTTASSGTSYDYQVAAIDAGGTGAFSATQTATTPAAVPGQPGPLSATTNGTSEIDLSWGAASGASSYDVQRGLAGTGTFPTDLGPVSGTTFNDTGLSPGDSFQYRVVPSNTSGNGPASNTATATTLPAQVTGLNANAASSSEIDLTWNAAAGAASYTVQRAPHGSTSWVTVHSGGTATSFADTTVASSTAYDYQVAAVNPGGTGAFSATQSATTPGVAPGQVTGLNATAVASSEVDLAWTATPGATAYEVDRSTTSASAGFSTLTTGLSSPAFADHSVSPATTYWYEVIASNTTGPGPASAAATATTPAVNAPLLANSFEGGTNGAALTAANSGGTSGNALNTVSCTSGTATYTNATAAHGVMSGLLSPTTAICYAQWSKSITATGASYGRAYVNLSANPAGAFGLLRVTDAAFTRDVQVNLSKTGKLSILDAGGTTQVTFTQSIPLNHWVRLEWHIVSAASGTFELRMYSGDSTTLLESHTVTGVNTGSSVGAVQVGAISAVAGGLGTTIGIDDLAYGTTGFFGPAS